MNKAEEKSKMISVRLTEESYDLLLQKAAENRMSYQDYIRRVLIDDEPTTLTQCRIDIQDLRDKIQYVQYGQQMTMMMVKELFALLVKRIPPRVLNNATRAEIEAIEKEAKEKLESAMEASMEKALRFHSSSGEVDDAFHTFEFEERLERMRDDDSSVEEE